MVKVIEERGVEGHNPKDCRMQHNEADVGQLLYGTIKNKQEQTSM